MHVIFFNVIEMHVKKEIYVKTELYVKSVDTQNLYVFSLTITEGQ